jgi:hypothetical protein
MAPALLGAGAVCVGAALVVGGDLPPFLISAAVVAALGGLVIAALGGSS